ncbi:MULTISPECIES: extracellular solute-binding protein [Rhodomicrobium]|uniref:extracellular solute-binding protein n=1 Tax=Rhodomicrobium TaxID=1068 RepID=UPI000B4BF2FC|nr:MULTISPECIES: extracellular solute-binding protein [Rhodomicrobium]
MTRLLSGLKLLSFSALVALTAASAQAQEQEKHYAMSLTGAPKYGPDFKHFDYVNPNAPKGGSVRMVANGTFDTFNLIPYRGLPAAGLGLIYDQLMVTSLDESSTEYPQIAEWVSYPADFSSATYKLREQARWHDGKPITPEDVIFSFNVQKENNPRIALYYKNVSEAKKTGDHEVTFYFDEKNNRELPQIIGQLNILPKHFYDNAGGAARDPAKTWMDIPLGSGPYRIKAFEPGRYVTYERVKDYWGAGLPINVGQNNIDEVRFDYYRERQVAFEAFKAGQIDYFNENSAKSWATNYEFPAITAGKVVKRGDIQLKNPEAMQGFVLNTRRAKFADPRVRRAFNLVYNFEWMNQNLFYGQYKRVSSFFENTELAAKGLPQGQELEILNTVRDQVPPEVFTTEYTNPVNGATPEIDRKNWREAVKLLQEAGWFIKDGVLVNAKTGEKMSVEFLVVQPEFERIVNFYRDGLKKLGVDVSVRMIDAAQYQKRTDEFDFDIIVDNFGQSESPGNEQRDFWGSAAADRPGSQNTIGIKNPAVDKLIDRIIFAKDRAELVAATRALDRVLLWNFYIVPQYYSPYQRIAYWNKYSHPDVLPSRTVGFPTVWWYDEAKAAKLATQ